jgi:hypothetical protein
MTLMSLEDLINVRSFFFGMATGINAAAVAQLRSIFYFGLRHSDTYPFTLDINGEGTIKYYYSYKQKNWVPVFDNPELQANLMEYVVSFIDQSQLRSYSSVVDTMIFMAPNFRMHQENDMIWTHAFRSARMRELKEIDGKSTSEITEIFGLSSDLITDKYLNKEIYYTGSIPGVIG